MPLEIKPPRQGKSPNYTIRGTYLGVYIDRTAGTPDSRQAKKVREGIKRDIERGDYNPQPLAVAAPSAPTFADAALAYLKADGDPNYLSRIIEQTGEHALRNKLLTDIDQIAIDNAADALYPSAPASTKNRQFYTPVSAVLKRAGVERKVKRPKGWRGNKATEWLEPEQAFAVIRAAYEIDPEFGLLCDVYLYTGERLSEPLKCELRHLKLDQSLLYVPTTKNGDPRPVHLPPHLVDAFRRQPARPARPRKTGTTRLRNGAAGRARDQAGVPFLDRPLNSRLFRFRPSGHLRKLLKLAFKRVGLIFPRRMGGFHIFCHTFGTWMHRYGGLDARGLARTGRWKDPDSADRYMHTKASEEARRADLLPVPPLTQSTRGKSVETQRRAKKA